MQSKRLFLRWALFVSLITIGAFIAAGLGWAGYVTDDPTHVTYVTLGVFMLATAWCGRLAWKLSSGQDPGKVEHAIEHSRYAAGLCFSIGLIGTAIGYYMMLKYGKSDGDAKVVINRTFEHASIAIINTVVGGVCAVIVEIQAHFIGHAAEKARMDAGKPPKEDAS